MPIFGDVLISPQPRVSGSPFPRRAAWGRVKPPSGAQIDWGHPLAQGLTECILLNESGGTPRLLSGMPPTTWTNTTWVPGGVRVSDATGDHIKWSPSGSAGIRNSAYTSATMLVRGYWPSAGSAGTYGSLYQLHGASGGEGVLYRRSGSPDYLTCYPDYDFNIGTPFPYGVPGSTLAAVMTPTYRRTYANGQWATRTVAGFVAIGWPQYIALGASGTQWMPGTYELAYAWDRALTVGELDWIRAEPYAFITPPGPKRSYTFFSAPDTIPSYSVPKTRGWGKQKPPSGARIDWGHPLAQGLMECVLFNEAGGVPNNLVRPNPRGTFVSSSSWVADGVKLVSGTGGVTFNGRTASESVTQITYLLRGSWPSVGAGFPRLMSQPNGQNSFLSNSNGANLSLNWANDVNTYNWASGIAVPSTPRSTIAAVANGTTLLAWANGRWNSKAYSTSAETLPNGTFYVGTSPANEVTLGTYELAYVWRRGLSLSELNWLHAEPYAFIAPPGRVSRSFSLEPPPTGPQPQTVNLTRAAAAWSARPFTPAGAARTTNVTAPTATWSARALSPGMVALTVNITRAAAAWSARAFAPTGAARSATLSPATATWLARALFPVGAKIVNITRANAAWSARALAPTGAAKTANLASPSAHWSARALAPSGAARSATLSPATAHWVAAVLEYLLLLDLPVCVDLTASAPWQVQLTATTPYTVSLTLEEC